MQAGAGEVDGAAAARSSPASKLWTRLSQAPSGSAIGVDIG